MARASLRLRGTVSYRLYASLGAGVWLLALLFARLFPAWFDGRGPDALLLYAATVVLAAIGVLVIRTALRPRSLIEAVAVGAATALLLDGGVMTALSFLYGPDEGTRRLVGAWLLFGSGTTVWLAILFDRRRLAANETETSST